MMDGSDDNRTMGRFPPHKLPGVWQVAVGSAAVIAGGLVAAFWAHQPSALAMWASAYLVLVVGVAQVGFGVALYYLAPTGKQSTLWFGVLLYIIGSGLVLIGTIFKGVAGGLWAIDVGGMTMAAALVCLLAGLRHAERSRLKVAFYILSLVIATSIPVGLWLSRH